MGADMLKAILVACTLLFLGSSARAQICEPSACWGDVVQGLKQSRAMICRTVAGKVTCRADGMQACRPSGASAVRQKRLVYRVPAGYRLQWGTAQAVATKSRGGSVAITGATETSLTCTWSCQPDRKNVNFVRGYCSAEAYRARG